MARDITDLRELLFNTIERLSGVTDGAPQAVELMVDAEVKAAEAICKVSEQLLATAKIELDFMRTTGVTRESSGFLVSQDRVALPHGGEEQP